jgi:hypothetical protein
VSQDLEAALLACPSIVREEVQRLRRWKSTNAPRLDSLQGLLEHERREAALGVEARATLASERAANAILTDELDALHWELDAANRSRDHLAARLRQEDARYMALVNAVAAGAFMQVRTIVLPLGCYDLPAGSNDSKNG